MNNLKKRRTSVLIGLALMGLSVHAYAADVTAATDTPTTVASTEANGASESHVINVTANRMALLNLDTPAAMDVITDKDIMNSGAKNAFDAVNMVPGITSFSYGASGLEYGAMDSRVNIRGLERGSLILVNGVPMNLNGKGGLSSIPTGSIARIEVLKGAASALYGSDAMSGVVNVITKTPTKEGGSATIGVGNMGSQTYKINYGTPRFLIGIERGFFGKQDPSTPVRTDSVDHPRGYEYYTARDKGNSLGIFMSGKLSDKVTLNFSRFEGKSAYAQLSTESNATNRNRHSTTYAYDDSKNNASLIYKDGNTTGILFYNDRDLKGKNRKHSLPSYTSNDSNYIARQYGFDVQHEWDFRGGKDYLIAGVLGKRETYRTTSGPVYASPHRHSLALYGSYSYQINPTWSTVVGLRYTDIKDPVKNQHVLTPQFQLNHRINKESSVYMNVGKAFTMPNLSDTFKTVNRQYQLVSGRNLKPEEGWNYELGYKHITNKDSWKVAAFYMDFKNFFSWKPDSNGKMTIRVNGGRFRNVGVEAQYGRKLTDRLKVTVGASYSNPKQMEIDKNYWKQANPKLQFTGGIHYNSSTWTAGSSINFVTKRMKNRDGGINPNLVAWNAYVGYQFNENSSIRLDARNLLNRHNVISNGDWEYWDEPFNYQLSYTQKF
ncbi:MULTISPECIES: TonB-dependent receptor plug domain-containing protein [Veillonella]|uniref:TonB-dependent receptor plug domain-containing protein n=1 Tax=Veillonella TaxID=29465 RepID=UPI00249004CE|nr:MULTISPECIES: TonB-dependent receptor [Veillonella]MDU5941257.1 TonB-dependent receptor [Veillonella sp.]